MVVYGIRGSNYVIHCIEIYPVDSFIPGGVLWEFLGGDVPLGAWNP